MSTFKWPSFTFLVKFVGVLLLVLLVGNTLSWLWDKSAYWDSDKNRGATAAGFNKADAMGDRYDDVVYLDQGWSERESLWFYNTTQGSNLLPYSFFLALEKADSETLFRSDENMNRLRYLVQKSTWSNPDALPVGMVKDTFNGKQYMGFTCAACHTGQVNYKNTAIRIDGGPAAADMVVYLQEMAAALDATLKDDAKFERFADKVIESGDYANEQEVMDELQKYSLRITMYNSINHSDTEYGYARLDAFGRIYNRVISHLLTYEQIENQLILSKEIVLTAPELVFIMGDANELLTQDDREEIVSRFYTVLTKQHNKPADEATDIITKTLRDHTFNEANAPVSYPFLWDITHSDFVQWNGIGDNGGVGPLGRNVGEVVGVFGTLNWHMSENCEISDIITGQCNIFGKPTKDQLMHFDSSVNMRNLRAMEQQLTTLESPSWKDDALKDVLPKIDTEKALRGKAIFKEYCIACHHALDRTDEYRKVVAFMGNKNSVGTDPQMADNSVFYNGKSGFLQDTYIKDVQGANLVMQEEMPVAVLLTYVTKGVVGTPDPDKGMIVGGLEWLFTLYKSLTKNDIQTTNKQGDYIPPTENAPFTPLLAYKGRPLNGIWATAPYLHNGSVPTLYDLLLPSECAAETSDCEKRPGTFQVGSRELDAKKVGFVYEGYDGFTFDTSLPGNSNKGHEYAAGVTPVSAGGDPLPPLTEDERWDLVEYMKTL